MPRPGLVATMVTTASILAVNICLAKLGLVKFDELLKESSLIVLARSTESVLDQTGSGHALLNVEKVVRGRYSDATIRIAWRGGEDFGIYEVGRAYLLFLRKDRGEYSAAVRGVSIWSVSDPPILGLGQVVEYVGHTALVTVPEELITTVESPLTDRRGRPIPCSIEVIPLDGLLKAIRARGGGTG